MRERTKRAGRRLPARAAGWLLPRANPGGPVLGLIVMGALMAAETDLHTSYADTLASALLAAAIYWLAHGYATALGSRLTAARDPERHLTPRLLARSLAHDSSLELGALLPIVVLAIAWAAGADHQTAVIAAMWSAIAALVAFELLAGIRSHATPRELALEATVGVTMALGVLALKLLAGAH